MKIIFATIIIVATSIYPSTSWLNAEEPAKNEVDANSVNANGSTKIRIGDEATTPEPRLADYWELCPPGSRHVSEPCPKFIKHYYKDRAPQIQLIIDGIDGHKDRARDAKHWYRQLIVLTHALLVGLSAIVTIMISLEKVRNIDLRRWAIIPTAFIAVVSSTSSFIDPQATHAILSRQHTTYATILSRVNHDLLNYVSEGDMKKVDSAWMIDLKASVDKAALQSAAEWLRSWDKRVKQTQNTPNQI